MYYMGKVYEEGWGVNRDNARPLIGSEKPLPLAIHWPRKRFCSWSNAPAPIKDDKKA
jgi:hypothetical protein